MDARLAGNIGNIITTGLGIYQSVDIHKKVLKNEEKQHEEEMKLLREQHQKELTIAKQTYLISTFTDIEQYCQELNENLINNSRDAERDMVDQRNQQFQTILIASTIMLGALVEIILQGILPDETENVFRLIYAFTTAAGFFFIIICILLCIEICSRVTRFMYKRSWGNMIHLAQAMSDTRQMMSHIRGETSSIVNQPDDISNGNDESLHKSPTPFELKRQFSTAAEKDLEEQWGQHEKEIHKYLARRERINEQIEMIAVGNHNSARISFEEFWNETCKSLGNSATVVYYIGTCLVLLSTMVYMYSTSIYSYGSRASAYVATSTLGIALIFSLGLAVYLRYFDSSIAELNESLERENDSTKAMYMRIWLSFSNSIRFRPIDSQSSKSSKPSYFSRIFRSSKKINTE